MTYTGWRDWDGIHIRSSLNKDSIDIQVKWITKTSTNGYFIVVNLTRVESEDEKIKRLVHSELSKIGVSKMPRKWEVNFDSS
jgi:hypothetical protein